MNALAPTLTNRYLSAVHRRFSDSLLVVGGVFFVAALAQVRIPLPLTPIPLTGQTFAVLFIGALFGSRRGAASLTLYLGMGALGFPFFAGGAGGAAYLFGPTFGYLIGFVAAAFVTGLLAERGLERNLRTSLLPFLVGTAVIYLFGAGWLALSLGVPKALLLGVLPFIAGDTAKAALAALALPAIWKLIR